MAEKRLNYRCTWVDVYRVTGAQRYRYRGGGAKARRYGGTRVNGYRNTDSGLEIQHYNSIVVRGYRSTWAKRYGGREGYSGTGYPGKRVQRSRGIDIAVQQYSGTGIQDSYHSNMLSNQ